MLCYLSSVGAQEDSILVDQSFVFENGVYRTFTAFQQNRPDIAWEDIQTNWITNPQTLMTQVEYIIEKESGEMIDLEGVWGIVIDATPYIQIQQIDKPLPVFAGFRVWGNICYFAYEEEVMIKVPIKAYNPNTGRPFRSGFVKREETVLRERILRFETGEMADFNYDTMLEWVENDRTLWRALDSLSPEEAEERLFRTLLIYDERNAVYIRNVSSKK